MSDEQLYKEYGEPQLEVIRRLDRKHLTPRIPKHAVLPMWFRKASDELPLSEAKISLTNFDATIPPSYSSDIWSLGCCIWDIIAQSPLFESHFKPQDDVTCEQVDALGILPSEWWKQWERRHNRFTEDGKLINRNSHRSLEDRFEDSMQRPRKAEGMPPIDLVERDALLSMLRVMLRVMLRLMLSFRPESRPTAKQILLSEWMVKWALPECHKPGTFGRL